jgi:hypothetical protein
MNIINLKTSTRSCLDTVTPTNYVLYHPRIWYINLPMQRNLS